MAKLEINNDYCVDAAISKLYLCYKKFIQMYYTIIIDDKEAKAKSIVNMLKELAQDYPFLTIYDDSDVQENILQELDARYEYMQEHPDDWKTWEEVKNNILNS